MARFRKALLAGFAAISLLSSVAAGFAQVAPPVPALPDSERRTSYSISASTCSCAIGFSLFGDSNDFSNWLEVFVNGVRMPAAGNWTITSPSGTIGSIPLPITNAVLTFTAPQTGTVQIVGARRPRRTSQFNEGAGIPTRNMNVVISDLTAQNRELWDKTNDVTGRALMSQPGNTLSMLPLPSACGGKFLGFDATGLIPQCNAGGPGSGNVVGPVSSTVGHIAQWNNTTGTLLADSSTITGPYTFTGDMMFASGRPWVDVVGKGADPTGVADSTTAIQSAINALAAASGGIVYFPPGTYKISSALTISSSYISLIGSGRLASVIRTTAAAANIISVTVPYATVDSLGLVGTTGTVATAGSAISAVNAHGSKFTNLYISDVFSGIGLNNSTNALVQFVKVLNIYGPFGVASSNGGGDYIVDNQLDPVFYGAYTSASGFGAWATSTAYTLNQVRSANGGYFVCSQAGTSASGGSGPAITAFNTQITDGTAKWYFIGSTSSIGVQLASTSNSNFVTNNDISGPWSTGVQITSSDGNSILSNTIGQILGLGVQLSTSATNTLVQGNVVSGAYGQFAIAIGDTTAGTAVGNRIVNNFINGAGWYGIFIQSANNIVSGNTVTGAGQVTSVYGIEVAANVNDFTISGNNIIASAGMTGPIRVNAGTSNFYNIIGNVVDSGTIVDSGSGTTKVVITTTTGSGSTAVLATSPAFAGTPTAPTAAVDTNTTQLATTAMVLGQAASATPAAIGTAAVGTSTRYARADHVHAHTALNNSLGSPVTMTTQGTYYDGASVAQGSTGTWFVSGTATVAAVAANNIITCKLWDGTTVIDSGAYQPSNNLNLTSHLSGYLASPAGNLRISCTNNSASGGTIATTNGVDAKASTISTFRIQ